MKKKKNVRKLKSKPRKRLLRKNAIRKIIWITEEKSRSGLRIVR